MCACVFIALLLTLARTGKEPRFPSFTEWMMKNIMTIPMYLYSAVKKNLNFKEVVITGKHTVTQTQKQKCGTLSLIHGHYPQLFILAIFVSF